MNYYYSNYRTINPGYRTGHPGDPDGPQNCGPGSVQGVRAIVDQYLGISGEYPAPPTGGPTLIHENEHAIGGTYHYEPGSIPAITRRLHHEPPGTQTTLLSTTTDPDLGHITNLHNNPALGIPTHLDPSTSHLAHHTPTLTWLLHPRTVAGDPSLKKREATRAKEKKLKENEAKMNSYGDDIPLEDAVTFVELSLENEEIRASKDYQDMLAFRTYRMQYNKEYRDKISADAAPIKEALKNWKEEQETARRAGNNARVHQLQQEIDKAEQDPKYLPYANKVKSAAARSKRRTERQTAVRVQQADLERQMETALKLTNKKEREEKVREVTEKTKEFKSSDAFKAYEKRRGDKARNKVKYAANRRAARNAKKDADSVTPLPDSGDFPTSVGPRHDPDVAAPRVSNASETGYAFPWSSSGNISYDDAGSSTGAPFDATALSFYDASNYPPTQTGSTQYNTPNPFPTARANDGQSTGNPAETDDNGLFYSDGFGTGPGGGGGSTGGSYSFAGPSDYRYEPVAGPSSYPASGDGDGTEISNMPAVSDWGGYGYNQYDQMDTFRYPEY